MSSPLSHLEQKLDQLIDYCQRLEGDHRSFKAERQHWHNERAKLVQQNRLARERLETLLERLKQLEHR